MKTNRNTLLRHRTLASALAFTGLLAVLVAPVFAQSTHEVVDVAYDESSNQQAEVYTLLERDELEDLAAPIALYPDDLVSLVLPAASYPVQVVQAARFLEARDNGSTREPPEDWDDAVVALLNYPEVITLMNDDLDWTWALGEAFLNQQSELMDAIAEFRGQAYAAGNLKSDERQRVTVDHEVIEIEPADPEIIYVPYYEPAQVIIYQPRRVYYYHDYPRYSYYYPYPADYSFAYGYFFGVTTAYRLHWSSHRLYTYHHGYRGHPYYGRGYHNNFYSRHRPYRLGHPRQAYSRGGYAGDAHRGAIWKPRSRHGSRPRSGVRTGYSDRQSHSDQRSGQRADRGSANTATRSGFASNRSGQRDNRAQKGRTFSDANTATSRTRSNRAWAERNKANRGNTDPSKRSIRRDRTNKTEPRDGSRNASGSAPQVIRGSRFATQNTSQRAKSSRQSAQSTPSTQRKQIRVARADRNNHVSRRDGNNVRSSRPVQDRSEARKTDNSRIRSSRPATQYRSPYTQQSRAQPSKSTATNSRRSSANAQRNVVVKRAPARASAPAPQRQVQAPQRTRKSVPARQVEDRPARGRSESKRSQPSKRRSRDRR